MTAGTGRAKVLRERLLCVCKGIRTLGVLEFIKTTFVNRLFRPFLSCLYLLPVGYLVPPAEQSVYGGLSGIPKSNKWSWGPCLTCQITEKLCCGKRDNGVRRTPGSILSEMTACVEQEGELEFASCPGMRKAEGLGIRCETS